MSEALVAAGLIDGGRARPPPAAASGGSGRAL